MNHSPDTPSPRIGALDLAHVIPIEAPNPSGVDDDGSSGFTVQPTIPNLKGARMSRTSPTHNDATLVARPQRVTLACALVVLLAVLNIVGPLMPKSEGDIGFGIVSALIALVAAWGLATLRGWGRVVTIVVAVLNVLSDAPAVAVGSTVLIKVVAAATVLGWVAVLVLVVRREVPRASLGE